MLPPWKKSHDQPRQYIKKQRHYFASKGPSSQSYGFSSHHVQMWELDYKEGWESKNWCLWTVVLEKTLESPLDCKEIKPVNPKGNQPWIFIGRTDAEAEVLVLWPPDAKSQLFGRLWCWERLRARGEGDDREWDAWMASVTQWNLKKLREIVKDREACHTAIHGVIKWHMTKQLHNNKVLKSLN